MSRPAPLLLAALVLVGHLAAGQPDSRPQFTIAGTVTSSSTGDPLRHARVFAVGIAGAVPATLSDDRGRYALSRLVPGRYLMTVVKPGYAKQSMPVDVPIRNDASLDVALARGAVIAGTLIDELGEPPGSTSVAIRAVKGDAPAGTVAVVQTDDLGQFRARGLAAGNYFLEVWPGVSDLSARVVVPGYGAASRNRIFFPGVSDVAAAQKLALQPGDERTGIVIAVPTPSPFLTAPLNRYPTTPDGRPDPRATAVVRGRVTRPDGSPVRGAQVNATLVGRRPSTATSSTDSDGNFEVIVGLAPVAEGMDPPAFRVTAFKAAYQSADFGQRSPTTRGVPFPLAAGEVREHVDITMQPLGVISGRILDDAGEPVEDALVRPVQLRYINGRRQLVDVGTPRLSDDLGRFRLFGLRPGQYAVSASVGQIVVAQPSVDLPGFGTTYYPGTTDPQAIQFVRVNPSQEVSAVDFALGRMRSARVAGRALDAEGDPITGGIALMPSQRSGSNTDLQMGARIDPKGGFEFRNVPPGDYVLQVVHGRSGSWNEGEFAYRYISVTDSDLTDLEIQTSVGSFLAGHIVSDSGELPKVDSVELSAFPVDIDRTPRIGGPPARARVQADGSFELAGISGPRRLQVVRAPTGWMLQSVRARGSDVTDQVLSFGRDDESIDDVEIVLTNKITQVLGSLSGSRGLAPSDLAVLAFATDPAQWYPGTRFRRRINPSADGHFSIDGLPPGDYFIVAAEPPRDPGEWLNPETLDRLSRGATRVHLSDAGRVSVTVRPGGS